MCSSCSFPFHIHSLLVSFLFSFMCPFYREPNRYLRAASKESASSKELKDITSGLYPSMNLTRLQLLTMEISYMTRFVHSGSHQTCKIFLQHNNCEVHLRTQLKVMHGFVRMYMVDEDHRVF